MRWEWLLKPSWVKGQAGKSLYPEEILATKLSCKDISCPISAPWERVCPFTVHLSTLLCTKICWSIRAWSNLPAGAKLAKSHPMFKVIAYAQSHKKGRKMVPALWGYAILNSMLCLQKERILQEVVIVRKYPAITQHSTWRVIMSNQRLLIAILEKK